MINILIVKNNVPHLLKLSNYIANSFSTIRICSMLTNGSQVLALLKTFQVDLILLDLDLPDYSAVDILNKIFNLNKSQYSNCIIVTSKDKELITKVQNHPCVYSSIFNLSIEKLNNIISDFIKDHEKYTLLTDNIIKEKILLHLKSLHYNFSYIGTKFLVDCIYESYKLGNAYSLNLNKNIYPIISQKYNKSINTIKCNILHATNAMYSECSEETLKKYFITSQKPTSKKVVFSILEKL